MLCGLPRSSVIVATHARKDRILGGDDALLIGGQKEQFGDAKGALSLRRGSV